MLNIKCLFSSLWQIIVGICFKVTWANEYYMLSVPLYSSKLLKLENLDELEEVEEVEKLEELEKLEEVEEVGTWRSWSSWRSCWSWKSWRRWMRTAVAGRGRVLTPPDSLSWTS